MKKILFLVLFLAPLSVLSQVNINKYNPRVIDGPARRLINYQWPYYNSVPSYIGIVGGYQGFKSSYYSMGLVYNFMKSDQIGTGGMAGIQLLHKRHFREDIQSFEGELGIYSIICFGVNANYNVSGEHTTFGVRPFIGLSLFNVQFSWGYNFYSKLNEIEELRHSNWEIKYVFPILRTNRKEKRYYTPYQLGPRQYRTGYDYEYYGVNF